MKSALRLASLVLILAANSAVANPLLVFTENSSTVLKATVGGLDYGTVVNTATDEWLWTAPHGGRTVQSSLVLEPDVTFWAESDNPRFGNWINGAMPTADLSIFSDYNFTYLGNASVPDGTIRPNMYRITYTDGWIELFDVQFVDQADLPIPTVPDQSATMGLLVFSGVLLFSVTRCRRFRGA